MSLPSPIINDVVPDSQSQAYPGWLFPMSTATVAAPVDIPLKHWLDLPIDVRAPMRSVAMVHVGDSRFVAIVFDTVAALPRWRIDGRRESIAQLYDGMLGEPGVPSRGTLIMSAPLAAAGPGLLPMGRAPGAVPSSPPTGRSPGAVPSSPPTGRSPGAVPSSPPTGRSPGAVPSSPPTGRSPGAVPSSPPTGRSPGAVPDEPGESPTAAEQGDSPDLPWLILAQLHSQIAAASCVTLDDAGVQAVWIRLG
jgi:hypothetical protein